MLFTGRGRISRISRVDPLLSILVAIASGATNSLIKNGSFEKPTVPPGGYEDFSDGFTIPHWKVVGFGVVAIVSGTYTVGDCTFPARAGQQWLNLAVDDTRVGIVHTLDTVPGAAYTLTFYVGNSYYPCGHKGGGSTVNVLVNGVQVYSATNSRGKGQKTMVWEKFMTTITATSSKTKLEFRNGDRFVTYNGLDDVKLTLQVD